jgi:hypothetical protein
MVFRVRDLLALHGLHLLRRASEADPIYDDIPTALGKNSWVIQKGFCPILSPIFSKSKTLFDTSVIPCIWWREIDITLWVIHPRIYRLFKRWYYRIGSSKSWSFLQICWVTVVHENRTMSSPRNCFRSRHWVARLNGKNSGFLSLFPSLCLHKVLFEESLSIDQRFCLLNLGFVMIAVCYRCYEWHHERKPSARRVKVLENVRCVTENASCMSWTPDWCL